MYQKIMLKSAIVTLFALASFQLMACGDNPMDVENEKQPTVSFDLDATFDSLDAQRANIDNYTCYQETKLFVKDSKKRCDNFLNLFGKGSDTDTILDVKTIIKMVKDEDNYDNKGRFIGKNEDPKINYLLMNKMLGITLTSYKQTVKSISEDEDIGDPEIRFLVKSYINLEPSEYDPYSAIALDTLDVKEWKGKKKVAVQLPRGIDAIEICPILRDKNEHDDYYDDEDLLDQSLCVSVKNLGWVAENSEKSVTSEGEKAKITWSWFIYQAD